MRPQWDHELALNLGEARQGDLPFEDAVVTTTPNRQPHSVRVCDIPAETRGSHHLLPFGRDTENSFTDPRLRSDAGLAKLLGETTTT